MSPKIQGLPESGSSMRSSITHQAIEDYLKTIYMLNREESPVSTSRLAAAREVKPASVTGMIKRLAGLKLVNYEKHYGVTLTPAGERIALEVIRHHRLLELYLIEALGFEWDEVHEQADILEHFISEKLEDRIAAALDHPEFDPHGHPIPSKELSIALVAGEPLVRAAVGTTVRIVKVEGDDDSAMLRYLGELGLVPGATLTVLDVAPFDGPVTVLVDDATRVVGYNVAAIVRVAAVTE